MSSRSPASSTPVSADGTGQVGWHRLGGRPEAGALVGFGCVFLSFALLVPDTFLSDNAFSSILTSQAVPGIMAIGVTLLMISGEFDLSVGSIMGVASLVFLYSLVSGLHLATAFLLGMTAGGLMGLCNGLLLVWTGIPSFIITLGTMLAYRAIALTSIAGGRIIRYADHARNDPTLHLPHWALAIAALLLCILVAWAGRESAARHLRTCRAGFAPRSAGVLLTWAVVATAAGGAAAAAVGAAVSGAAGGGSALEIDVFYLLNGRLPRDLVGGNYRLCIAWWLLLSLLFGLLLNRTRWGNALFATGGNAAAARAQGVDVDRVRITTFTLCGLLAAFAGIVQVARLKSVDPLRGQGMELEVIAAVVIGGTLLTGGFGSIAGTVIGTTLTGMLRTGLVLLSVPANAFRGAIGAIMIAAVVINTFVLRRR